VDLCASQDEKKKKSVILCSRFTAVMSNTSSMASIAKLQLPFRVEALLDLYAAAADASARNGHSRDQLRASVAAVIHRLLHISNNGSLNHASHNDADKGENNSVTTRDVEMALSSSLRVNCAHFSNAFGAVSYMWAADVYFSCTDPYSHDYTIVHRGPVALNSKCAVGRAIGTDRLMTVSVHGIVPTKTHHASREFWAQRLFFCQGIRFGGKLFRFFGCKDCDRKLTLKNVRSDTRDESAESNSRVEFVCWFIAVDWTRDGQSEEELLCSRYPPPLRTNFGYWARTHEVSVRNLRIWYGDFSAMSILKMNARLSLGFSNGFPSPFRLSTKNVFIVRDVTSRAGNCMTDGCGMIAVSQGIVLLLEPVLLYRFV
jgi:hypothetical protein